MLVLISLGTTYASADVSAAWQEDLEQHFDIVETFDRLQNWNGMKTGYSYGLDDRPKLESGAYSTLWHGFSNDRIIFSYSSLNGTIQSGEVISFNPSGATFIFDRFYSENGKEYIQGRNLVGKFTEEDYFSASGGASGDVSEIPLWIGDHGPE